jgi:hypothetical protein
LTNVALLHRNIEEEKAFKEFDKISNKKLEREIDIVKEDLTIFTKN